MDANFCKGILQFRTQMQIKWCQRRYGILAGHFGLRGPKSSKFFFGSKIHNEHNQTFSKISVKLQQISWKAVRKLNVPKHESVKNNKTMFLDQYNFFTN